MVNAMSCTSPEPDSTEWLSEPLFRRPLQREWIPSDPAESVGKEVLTIHEWGEDEKLEEKSPGLNPIRTH